MALSDFIGNNLKRINDAMARLAHTTMMGDNGMSDPQVLICMGKYRQMKAERDYWLAFKKKRDVQESRLEEMPDDPEDELPEPEEEEPQRRPQIRRQPKQWGG